MSFMLRIHGSHGRFHDDDVWTNSNNQIYINGMNTYEEFCLFNKALPKAVT